MNVKKAIINNYYISNEIVHILPHSISRYFNLVYRYVFALIFLYILYFLFWSYIQWIDFWFGIIWVFLYLAFVYSFGDIYLDAEILTDEYLVTLDNNGFVWSSTNYYDLDHIDSVSFSQQWRMDYLLDTGDISISMHDTKLQLHHIYNPKKQVQSIIKAKNQYLLNKAKKESEKLSQAQVIDAGEEETKTWTITDEKFNMLVDSLSEIVSDYIKKWVPDHQNDQYDPGAF